VRDSPCQPKLQSSARSSVVRTSRYISVDALKDPSKRAAEYERQFRAFMAKNPSNRSQIITECEQYVVESVYRPLIIDAVPGCITTPEALESTAPTGKLPMPA
jgi:hypothetical protein